jgi:hypothetical protein
MAAPVPGSMDPTAYERQERLMAHALGRSHIEIATRFGISVQASKMFKAVIRTRLRSLRST